MNSPSLLDPSPEAYEVIRIAQPYQFAIMLIGFGMVMILLAMGGMLAQFPATRNVPLWVGVWVTFFILCLVFRKFFFGERQLQIGTDRFRILDESGKVAVEVPYAIIASIQLVHKTVVEEREAEFFNPLDLQDGVVRGAKESLRGI
jgi:hypothetical protein